MYLMREWTSAVYWIFTGALMGFGFLAAFTIGIPFLFAGVVMAVFGMFMLWIRGAWAITLGLGGVPIFVLAQQIIAAATSPAPPCAPEGSATLPTSAGEGASIACTTPISGAHIVGVAFFAVIALSGVAWRLFLRGRFSRAAADTDR
ncbi:MAG: hypothetical protein ACRDSJ_19875 [Rubrobacteraceae bacterium]